jgi:hypothetical protein
MTGEERKMDRNGLQEDFINLNGPKRCGQGILNFQSGDFGDE